MRVPVARRVDLFARSPPWWAAAKGRRVDVFARSPPWWAAAKGRRVDVFVYPKV